MTGSGRAGASAPAGDDRAGAPPPPGGQGRRAELLAVAARLFAERGFEPATVREIGKAAAILSGSIYYHFATKEEILHAIVRPAAASMAARSHHIAASAHDAEVRIAALVLLSWEELLSDPDAFAILYNERQLFRRTPSFAYVAAAKERAYDAWAAVLADGKAAGMVRPGLDAFMAITTVVRMLNTSADWYRHGAAHGPADGEATAERLIAFSLDFVFHAIRTTARAVVPVPRAAAAAAVRDSANPPA